MYQSLDIFQTASAMARHAGTRQAVVARNIANADTPAFQAQQITPFKDTYQASHGTPQRVTRAGHMTSGTTVLAAAVVKDSGTPSPNGNTVSIEEELLNSVSVAREHNRALAVYRHAMTVLRTSIGRG